MSATAARRARPPAPAGAAPRAKPPDAGSRSCRGARSFPPPFSAVRPVLKDDALGLELVADAVGCGEVARVFRRSALGNASFDGARIGIALEPLRRGAFEQAEQPRTALDRVGVFERD